jgi:hypothetical protein
MTTLLIFKTERGLTVDEYFLAEQTVHHRHEFVDGCMTPASSGDARDHCIGLGIIHQLKALPAKQRPQSIFTENVERILDKSFNVLPEMPKIFHDAQFAIVQFHYQFGLQLAIPESYHNPNCTDHWVTDLKSVDVAVMRREPDSSWSESNYSGGDAIIPLSLTGSNISLARVYRFTKLL